MGKYKLSIITTAILLIIAVALVYSLKAQMKNGPQSCTAEIMIVDKDFLADVTLSFVFVPHYGTVAVTGRVYDKDKDIGFMQRNVSFEWKSNGNNFILTSKNINVFEYVESLPGNFIQRILPDFYFSPGAEISHTIKRYGKGEYIFSKVKRPVLFCST